MALRPWPQEGSPDILYITIDARTRNQIVLGAVGGLGHLAPTRSTGYYWDWHDDQVGLSLIITWRSDQMTEAIG